jgi:hypothetical protein
VTVEVGTQHTGSRPTITDCRYSDAHLALFPAQRVAKESAFPDLALLQLCPGGPTSTVAGRRYNDHLK